MSTFYHDICDRLDREVGLSFGRGNPDDIAKLQFWKIPESIVAFYRDCEPQQDRRSEIVHDVYLYDLASVIAFSEEEVGELLLPHGYLVFGSTRCGDMLCFDLNQLSNEGEPAVVKANHEYLCTDEESISAEEAGDAIEALAPSFTVFLQQFADGEIKT